MTTCQVCGKETEDDNLIVLEGRRVCPACKPLVVQQLKEGCLPPMVTPIEVADHELDFRELIQKTWSICRQDWPVIVGLQLLGTIPLVLQLAFHSSGGETDIQQAPSVWGSFLIPLLGMLLGILPLMGVAWVVSERVAGRSLSFGEALGKAVRRWLPAFGTNIIMGLGVGCLSLLLIVPGIMFLVYWIFAIDVVALRNCAATRALDYSKSLVKGRWWRVAGKSLVLTLPSLVPSIIYAVAVRFLPGSRWIEFSGNLIIELLSAFYEVGMVLFFLNLDALAQNTPLSEITLGAKLPEAEGG